MGETGCGKSTTARLWCGCWTDGRPGPVRGRGHRHASRVTAEGAAPADADDLPGSVLLAESAQDRGSIIAEPFAIHGLRPAKGERKKRVQDLMDRVGLNPEHYNRYPHEFSGGQRQRIGVARAIALSPASGGRRAGLGAGRLDSGAGAKPAQELQRELGLTLIFIAHDLSVVRHIATGSPSCTWARSSSSPPTASFTASRATRTQARSSPRCRCRPAQGNASAAAAHGDVPSPANPPPRAGFIPAVRRRRSCALRRSRRWKTRAAGRSRPATSL